MRTFDFTQLGGFPVTQDVLNFMQSGYINPIAGIAAMGDNTSPFIISGMKVTGSTVSDGWLYYAGEVIPFLSGTISTYITIVTTLTNLEYGDGNNHEAKRDKFASFGSGPVQFPYADLKLFHEGFGARALTGWTTAEVPVSPAGMTCFYHYNRLTKTVHVRGSAAHRQDLFSGNPGFMQVGTLPAEISPSYSVPFRTTINTHQTPVITDNEGATYTGEVGRVSGSFISISSRVLASGVSNPVHNYYFSYQL